MTSKQTEAAVGRGMATAAAILARQGEDTLAAEILNAAGYSDLKEMKRDGVCEVDIKPLAKLFDAD